MKLSTKGKYGIKAMVDLALNYGDKPVSIKSISKRQGISEYYLEQLFNMLKKSDLIVSIRGAQGGYILAREPKDINILSIMNVLEGPVEISSCASGVFCPNNCATRLLWRKMVESINEVMSETTLKDIVDDYKIDDKLVEENINYKC